jgi:hypothetical protein
MQTIHIATWCAARGSELLALAKVNDSDIEYGGGVKDAVAETLLSKLLPRVDQEKAESIVFTYVDEKGMPQQEEDFLFYMEAGCCAKRLMWVNRVRLFRMQLRSFSTVPVIDLTVGACTSPL